MTMQELTKKSNEELSEIAMFMAKNGNLKAVSLIHDVQTYYGKQVKVVKGRKVPIGVTGQCFWMGAFDNSKYGDTWGIYSNVRIGIKDKNNNVYWTSLKNVEIVKA